MNDPFSVTQERWRVQGERTVEEAKRKLAHARLAEPRYMFHGNGVWGAVGPSGMVALWDPANDTFFARITISDDESNSDAYLASPRDCQTLEDALAGLHSAISDYLDARVLILHAAMTTVRSLFDGAEPI